MSNGENVMTQQLRYKGLNKTFRELALKLLAHLQDGHLVLRENDQLIAEFGRKGSDIHAEVNVRRSDFYRRLVMGGSIAAGELYVEHAWETPDLTSVIRLFARNLPALDKLEQRFAWLTLPFQKFAHWKNRNNKQQAKANIAAHYDLGNELYTRFLDQRMQYSSAVYPAADSSLDEAQEYKIRRLCEDLRLTADDHLLEIGTGWGGLAIYAAQHYGCKVTTTTISEEQYRYAQEQVEKHGLQQQITLLKQDYRDLTGQYDKLVSVEMIEAVGKSFLPTFFAKCSELLKDNGRMALQAITIADQRMASYANSVDFIQKHIFPGGFLPSITMMSELLRTHTDLVVRQIHDHGLDYARTLSDWSKRFNQRLEELRPLGYDERFARLWNYYFHYCEGGFRERTISVVQLMATKPRCLSV
ncbi:SAM-dependent methyltransferase [Idiomarina tyrosinivorans]|uniref:SAM-dependent methyltransferase n=1 Tax=Idiomarina tyrosinivorans TaxID=1445662 RepID=A0A432ZUE0_9GAMM|nr:cyclopropane-fatty-acyl-phospholipid synthase family protein [Idiomarina tyrosinivorans]RUO81396.1 SAM-dependent methyltransferase [Idiomarina tyrosinivorans]